LLEQFLLQAELVIAALVVVIGLLMMWIIVSVPVWIAAKIVTLGKAKFTRAMLVTGLAPTAISTISSHCIARG
jgi:hypothetical protein